MKLVCNSSPLIFLAKLNKLELLAPYSVLIPHDVHEELLAKECAEKDLLEAFFKQKSVTIMASPKPAINSNGIGKGELAVINLALEHSITDVIMDDRRARTLARTVGLQTFGTIWVLLSAYKDGTLTKKKTYELICDLPLHGFRIDQLFLLQILKKLA